MQVLIEALAYHKQLCLLRVPPPEYWRHQSLQYIAGGPYIDMPCKCRHSFQKVLEWPQEPMASCLAHAQSNEKRKVGRPIIYCGDPDSPDLTPQERRRIRRRIANRESARRVRAKRQDLLEDMSIKVGNHLKPPSPGDCPCMRCWWASELDFMLTTCHKDALYDGVCANGCRSSHWAQECEEWSSGGSCCRACACDQRCDSNVGCGCR